MGFQIRRESWHRLFDGIKHHRQEAQWVILGQGIALLGSLASVKALTNLLSTEDYGYFALGLTIATLINYFIYSPFSNAVLRFYSVCRESENLGAYLKALKRMHVILFLAIAMVGLVVVSIVEQRIGGLWAKLITAAITFGVANGINATMLSLHNAMRKRRIVAAYQATDVWLRMFLAVSVIVLVDSSAVSAMFGYVIGCVLVGILQFGQLRRNMELAQRSGESSNDSEDRTKIAGRMLRYSASFTAIAACGVWVLFADKWIIQGTLGARDVGIYAAIYQIASAPVILLAGFLGQLTVPIIFDKAGGKQTEDQSSGSDRVLRLVLRVYIAAVVPLVLGAYYFGSTVVGFVTNTTIAEYGGLLWVVMAAIAIGGFAELAAVKGLSKQKVAPYILPKALQSIVFIVAAVTLVSPFGLNGVAAALVISAMVYMCAIVLRNKGLVSGDGRLL